ncbi:hypothetical protein [Saccharothrix hoggarensis]|uniref:Uncharacterized protein n=1 Tax=Saccharothrix hoggarensis TaxID=913853 RepID=A0ABW3QLS2_9PSEU
MDHPVEDDYDPDIPTPSVENDDLDERQGICGYPVDRTVPEFPEAQPLAPLRKEGDK